MRNEQSTRFQRLQSARKLLSKCTPNSIFTQEFYETTCWNLSKPAARILELSQQRATANRREARGGSTSHVTAPPLRQRTGGRHGAAGGASHYPESHNSTTRTRTDRTRKHASTKIRPRIRDACTAPHCTLLARGDASITLLSDRPEEGLGNGASFRYQRGDEARLQGSSLLALAAPASIVQLPVSCMTVMLRRRVAALSIIRRPSSTC